MQSFKSYCLEEQNDTQNWFWKPILDKARQSISSSEFLVYHGNWGFLDYAAIENNKEKFNPKQLGLHVASNAQTSINFTFEDQGHFSIFKINKNSFKPFQIKDDLGLWDQDHWDKWFAEKAGYKHQMGYSKDSIINADFFIKNGFNSISYPNMKEAPIGATSHIILDTSILEVVMVLDMSKRDNEIIVDNT